MAVVDTILCCDFCTRILFTSLQFIEVGCHMRSISFIKAACQCQNCNCNCCMPFSISATLSKV